MSSEQAHFPNINGPQVPLSERDAEHLGALQRHWKGSRTFPSMARLTGVLGLSSAAGVFGVLGRLTAAGYLERVERRIAPTARFFERPMLAVTCALLPPRAGRDQHESLNLDDYLIDDPARTTLHRVRGDHLCDGGIFDGDLVVVELRAPAQPGDIVLAVDDGCLTVDTLRRSDEGGYFLGSVDVVSVLARPQKALQVLGLVIGVARRLRRSEAHVTLVSDNAAAS